MLIHDIADLLGSYTRRRASLVIFATLLCFVVFFYDSLARRSPASTSSTSIIPAGSKEGLHGKFDGHWNYARDRRNFFLTQAQCDTAFPDLFKEVDRPVKLRKSNKISLKELDETPALNGFIRGMIYDQQVRTDIQGQGEDHVQALLITNFIALHHRNTRTDILSRPSYPPRSPPRHPHFPRITPQYRIHAQCRR